MGAGQRISRLIGRCFLFCLVLLVVGSVSGAEEATIVVYLPLVNRPLSAPTLNPIDNADQDNVYTVSWQPVAGSSYYVLERDGVASFSSPTVAYSGGNSSWSTPASGVTPGTTYYRVKVVKDGEHSPWSAVRSITIYPRFVGLITRWDGAGYIELGSYSEVGSHYTAYHDAMTEADTIRVRNHTWYYPNPLGLDESFWDSFYSVSTGNFLGSSAPGDPAWKWGYYMLLPYAIQLSAGQEIQIGGQPFSVSGPHSGVTAFGRTVQYWELVNTERFVLFDNESGWTQQAHPGDIVMRYHAGHTRLLLHSNIMRRIYEDGDLTEYYVRYIENLTYATSFTPDVAPPPLSTNGAVISESIAALEVPSSQLVLPPSQP